MGIRLTQLSTGLKVEAELGNKLRLSWAKLKFSLVRVVDEVTIIFNSVEVEIDVIVE